MSQLLEGSRCFIEQGKPINKREQEVAALLEEAGVGYYYERDEFFVPVVNLRSGEVWRMGCKIDFYLPSYDLYLEVTTIKSLRCRRRKNRQVRGMRAAGYQVEVLWNDVWNWIAGDPQRLLQFLANPEEVKAILSELADRASRLARAADLASLTSKSA